MWKPAAPFKNLQLRSELLNKIRRFFAERHFLEVETPLLSKTTNPDPNIHSLTTTFSGQTYYLQTSPEFAMKRLLATGCGPIYQICKAFRDEEAGPLHAPEFTILEWYRPGFTLTDLMDEVDAFLAFLLNCPPAKRISYQALFKEYLNIDPHTTTTEELRDIALLKHREQFSSLVLGDKDDWLHLLMSHYIEPHLKQEPSVFVFDYPASQAALATIRNSAPPVAERFEVYLNGIEIGNAFSELTDAKVQRERFLANNGKREMLGKLPLPIDEHLLNALEDGLPSCSGIAIGVDRLMMIAAHASKLSEVMSFGIESA